MKEEVLKSFSEYLEKQDVLCKLTENVKLHEYGYSEIHTIVAIKELNEPNVTAISNRLKMTKGAISKIIKKLLNNGMLESYQNKNNKQKIFYKLTENGEKLYFWHLERHILWEQRDDKFFSQFTNDEIELIRHFMASYNAYLSECINILIEPQEEK